MIIGNGIDIIETNRIKKAIDKNDKFLNRIFNEVEIEYIKNKQNNINTISGLFAAKEAVSKAIGTGIREFKWTDIVIDHDEFGKPIVNTKNKANVICRKKGIISFNISISHINEYAIAFAIAEGFVLENNENLELNIKNKYKIIDKYTVKNIIPKREKNSHKGMYGRVGVIAGSIGRTGANYLTSTAALRSGSGIVYSVIPRSLNIIMESKTTEVITKPIEDDDKGHFVKHKLNEIVKETYNMDVIAIGPGLGVSEDVGVIVREILKINKPIVLDADGLNCICKNPNILLDRKNITVITPHPKELSKLLNVSVDEIQLNRVKYAKFTSDKFKVITVLKGSDTIVCDIDGDIYINSTGNPGMAKAGSGDVLTGMIASLIGQNIKPLEASIVSVYLHGLSGDEAVKEKSEYGLIATDIIDNIPKALSKTISQN